VSNLITRPVPAHGSTRAEHFLSVRNVTEHLAAPLSAEDQTVQSMPDASPTKWHLAHTTWFFETFLLRPYARDYRVFDLTYEYLFNSYYEAVGPRHPRPQRGMITRPGVGEILAYRRHVSDAMAALLTKSDNRIDHLVELGLHHEQQHQELLLMDAKHLLAQNPLKPAYKTAVAPKGDARPLAWREFEGGLLEIGHDGTGFAFDNEGPRHRVWLEPFALATRPVSCGEYLAFMEDGGYRRPEFWLSAGWDCVGQRDWQAPRYWERDGDGWQAFTLSGLEPVDPARPVCHVSAYEAAAFAKWAGKRLPREQEWEIGAGAVEGIGQVWEWTASPYVAYPGYREPAGAIGEYNGKFMANQMVLRGGCAATPAGHMRTTYRNFFPPDARWMFGGLRLAEDLQ
jgi:ergothioneine biosynthesis protein EgtB